eukprot:scaffold5841_cov81-Cylindrotheca_fusiformis.AAC.3
MFKKVAKHLSCTKATIQHPEEAEDDAWIYNGQEEVPPTVRRVKIAENVIEIPDEAFSGHTELEEVILSCSVQVIGESAFYRCEKLKSILYQGREKKEVGIPPNVRVIGNDAFSECSLVRLVRNEGLREIGAGAFMFGGSVTVLEIPSTVKVIGKCAFLTCKLLARLVLNEGLEQIGAGAFFHCKSLTELEIPSTVKVIGDCTFLWCKLLARLVLNEGLERIGSQAFAKCESLSHVRIPRSVNIIATDAFVECSSMISIELPEERSFNIELSRCLSLVNLAAGQIVFPVGEWERFFQSSKLGSLVDDEADLIRKLNHRFYNSPVNKLCYYQSHQSLDVAMAELRSLMEDDPLATTVQVDGFGMTPLHVLSLSQTPNLDMLLTVMDAGKPGHMVRVRDSFGSTPMEYLCLNRMPNANDVIRRLFQTRFGQVLGLDQFWESDMLLAIDETLAGDWSSRRRQIGVVIQKFERKDILSLLELFLWKVKIDEVSSEELIVDREFCRVHSGASIVIPHVLSFFDNLDVEDSFSDQSSDFTSESIKYYGSHVDRHLLVLLRDFVRQS